MLPSEKRAERIYHCNETDLWSDKVEGSNRRLTAVEDLDDLNSLVAARLLFYEPRRTRSWMDKHGQENSVDTYGGPRPNFD